MYKKNCQIVFILPLPGHVTIPTTFLAKNNEGEFWEDRVTLRTVMGDFIFWNMKCKKMHDLINWGHMQLTFNL